MIHYAEVECMIYDAQSIKEKRSVIKSVKAKLRNHLNVAVTELDFHDLWQRTKLGIVTISTDQVHSEQIIQEALRMIETYPELERTVTHVERL